MPLTSNDVTHPEWCSPELCRTRGADIVHAEVGGVVAVESSGDVLAVSAAGFDELDRDGRQVAHEGEVVVVHDGRRLCLSVDEADAYADLLSRTAARARLRAPQTVPAG